MSPISQVVERASIQLGAVTTLLPRMAQECVTPRGHPGVTRMPHPDAPCGWPSALDAPPRRSAPPGSNQVPSEMPEVRPRRVSVPPPAEPHQVPTPKDGDVSGAAVAAAGFDPSSLGMRERRARCRRKGRCRCKSARERASRLIGGRASYGRGRPETGSHGNGARPESCGQAEASCTPIRKALPCNEKGSQW